jgi:hypothetical protein
MNPNAPDIIKADCQPHAITIAGNAIGAIIAQTNKKEPCCTPTNFEAKDLSATIIEWVTLGNVASNATLEKEERNASIRNIEELFTRTINKLTATPSTAPIFWEVLSETNLKSLFEIWLVATAKPCRPIPTAAASTGLTSNRLIKIMKTDTDKPNLAAVDKALSTKIWRSDEFRKMRIMRIMHYLLDALN